MIIAEIRERKTIFLTGLLYMFFFIFTIFYLRTAEDLPLKDTEDFLYILGIVFGAVISPLACLYALWDYFRKRLVLYLNYAVYFPLFGKKKIFYYNNIQVIQTTVSGKYRVLSHSGEILARFNWNMSGTAQALSFLSQKGIMTVPEPS